MEFKEFAQRPDAYAKLCSMIGPSIYGHSDVKKAIACLLFGGSKKVCIFIKWLMFPEKQCQFHLPFDSVLMLCFKLLFVQRLPDGVRLRGDIHVLLLGDPSTAKSQATIVWLCHIIYFDGKIEWLDMNVYVSTVPQICRENGSHCGLHIWKRLLCSWSYGICNAG